MSSLPPPPPADVAALGAPTTILRHTLTYIVVAGLVAASVLLVAFALFLYGQTAISLAIAVLVTAALYFYVRAQRAAWLVLHERGMRVVTRRTHEVLLWSDIASLKPTFSYVPSPATLIDLQIIKRTGGRLVLRNNWRPRAEFRALIQDLVFPADDNAAGPAA